MLPTIKDVVLSFLLEKSLVRTTFDSFNSTETSSFSKTTFENKVISSLNDIPLFFLNFLTPDTRSVISWNFSITDLSPFMCFGHLETTKEESFSDFILDHISSVINGIKGCITVKHFLNKIIELL